VVFKRYIKKHGKRLGPYYYQNVRGKDGKIKSVYIGQDYKKHNKKRFINAITLLSILLIPALFGFYYFFYTNDLIVTPQIVVDKNKVLFDVDQIIIKVLLKEEEFLARQIKITNSASKELDFSLNAPALDQIVDIKEKEFNLKPGQTKTIVLNFTTSQKDKNVQYTPGVYTGKLIVKADNDERIIPITVEIESKKVFFDINLLTLSADRLVKKGDEINFEIRIFNLEYLQSADVDMTYYLKDIDGNNIISQSETVAVKNQASFSKTIQIPRNANEGNYIFAAIATHGSSIGTATYLFDVIEEPKKIETRVEPGIESSIFSICKNDVYCWSLLFFIILIIILITIFAYFAIGTWLYFKLTSTAGKKIKKGVPVPEKRNLRVIGVSLVTICFGILIGILYLLFPKKVLGSISFIGQSPLYFISIIIPAILIVFFIGIFYLVKDEQRRRAVIQFLIKIKLLESEEQKKERLAREEQARKEKEKLKQLEKESRIAEKEQYRQLKERKKAEEQKASQQKEKLRQVEEQKRKEEDEKARQEKARQEKLRQVEEQKRKEEDERARQEKARQEKLRQVEEQKRKEEDERARQEKASQQREKLKQVEEQKKKVEKEKAKLERARQEKLRLLEETRKKKQEEYEQLRRSAIEKERILKQEEAKQLNKLREAEQEFAKEKLEKDKLEAEKETLRTHIAESNKKKVEIENAWNSKIKALEQAAERIKDYEQKVLRIKSQHELRLKGLENERKIFLSKLKEQKATLEKESEDYKQKEIIETEKKTAGLTKKEKETFEKLKALEIKSSIKIKLKELKHKQNEELNKYEAAYNEQREIEKKRVKDTTDNLEKGVNIAEIRQHITSLKKLEEEKKQALERIESYAESAQEQLKILDKKIQKLEPSLTEKHAHIAKLRAEFRKLRPGIINRIIESWNKWSAEKEKRKLIAIKTEEQNLENQEKTSQEKELLYGKINDFKILLAEINKHIENNNKDAAFKCYADLKRIYDQIAHSDALTVDAKKFLYERITDTYNKVKEIHAQTENKESNTK